jgi:deoxyribodipyrimidine photo-lyase
MTASIVWFRRDLRLTSNPALQAAIDLGLPIVALYIHAPEEEAPWAPGAASCWWLHHSLIALDAELRMRGAHLTVRKGSSFDELITLIEASQATHVFWNRLYEPATMARDAEIKSGLRAKGIHAQSFNACLLIEPWQIKTGSGEPYRVFTPYWRKLRSQLAQLTGDEQQSVDKIDAVCDLKTIPISDLSLLPLRDWADEFKAHWNPGEQGARQALNAFIQDHAADYASARDLPYQRGTSHLSPHLHFGELSPQQIVRVLLQSMEADKNEAFIRELGWRDFSYHLLFHYPHTTERSLNARFEQFSWRKMRQSFLKAWKKGQTGIPIVDAGMRELWQTGWMHNRVRMIVASFLTKNLRYHWKYGARWFWDTLVDADLASNTQGWQWSAGSGADAAPYFRIMNPVLQGERFDPKGVYVRRYIPELARVPDQFIHQPWALSSDQQYEFGIAQSIYSNPIIDLKISRAQALEAYHELRSIHHLASL